LIASFFCRQVTIKTDDMDLAGDIIQALATFLGIEVNHGQTSSIALLNANSSRLCPPVHYVFHIIMLYSKSQNKISGLEVIPLNGPLENTGVNVPTI